MQAYTGRGLLSGLARHVSELLHLSVPASFSEHLVRSRLRIPIHDQYTLIVACYLDLRVMFQSCFHLSVPVSFLSTLCVRACASLCVHDKGDICGARTCNLCYYFCV
jgi:hypothetical protein